MIMTVKKGDVVRWKNNLNRTSGDNQLGLVLGMYDSAHGYVNVMWWIHNKTHVSPCHMSKLNIVSNID